MTTTTTSATASMILLLLMAPFTFGFSIHRIPTTKRLRVLQPCLFFSSKTSVTDIMRKESVAQTTKLVDYYSPASSSNSSNFRKPIIWTSSEEAAQFVDQHVDALLFDCDGVLYRGKEISPQASATLEALLNKGKQCFFVTNNAASNRQELLTKISDLLNCAQLTIDQMIGSTYACAQYLKNTLPDSSRRRIHVVGSEGLCEEIRQAGFIVSGGLREDDAASMSREELAAYDFPEHPIDALCVGLDTAFTYRKLAIANVLLQLNPDANLVSTNQDAFDLVGADARHLPGNGCIVKALEHGSGRTAINVGKPSKVLADVILKQHSLDPARTMFVGDRLDTDIAFGNDHGMISVLVMTGVTTAQTIQKLDDEVDRDPLLYPQYIVPYMGMLA